MIFSAIYQPTRRECVHIMSCSINFPWSFSYLDAVITAWTCPRAIAKKRHRGYYPPWHHYLECGAPFLLGLPLLLWCLCIPGTMLVPCAHFSDWKYLIMMILHLGVCWEICAWREFFHSSKSPSLYLWTADSYFLGRVSHLFVPYVDLYIIRFLVGSRKKWLLSPLLPA